MVVILGYLKCSLKKVFQDAIKKFLPKKQEVAILYHRLTLIIKLKKIRVNSCNSWAKKGGHYASHGDLPGTVEEHNVYSISNRF